MNTNRCVIIGKVLAYLDQNPDGSDKLEDLLNDDKLLISTEDVADRTGWSTGYITRLCKKGLIPYIPGNPHKFMVRHLRIALEQMQTGGIYGRKTRTKRRSAA